RRAPISRSVPAARRGDARSPRRGQSLSTRLPPPAPRGDSSARLPPPARAAGGEHERAAEDAGDRQPPREQVEALVRRRREDPLAVVRDELRLDLLRGRALGDPLRD